MHSAGDYMRPPRRRQPDDDVLDRTAPYPLPPAPC